MDIAKALVSIKRVAAILLMACFFMPLSQCTAKVDPEGQKARAVSPLTGQQMAQDSLREIDQGQIDGVATLTGLFVVFFVPAVSLRLKDRAQTAILLPGSVVAAYFLYGWMFVFATKVQYGGVIAVACWIIIFCSTCISLLSHCVRLP